MPFENEHAARQVSPDKFDKFRRSNDKFGKGIHAIFGIKGNKSEVQSVRFDKSKFTVSQAKKWLKDHDMKTGGFEEAVKKRLHASWWFNEEGQIELQDLDINVSSFSVPEGVESADVLMAYAALGVEIIAASKRIKNNPDLTISKSFKVLKSCDEQQIVFGVVMEPETVDLEGEITSAAEIEKAAHGYLENYRVIKVNHDTVCEAVPVESFIAPTDMKIEGQDVKKGSWLASVKINDKEAWQEAKDGGFNAFSAGGSAERIAA